MITLSRSATIAYLALVDSKQNVNILGPVEGNNIRGITNVMNNDIFDPNQLSKYCSFDVDKTFRALFSNPDVGLTVVYIPVDSLRFQLTSSVHRLRDVTPASDGSTEDPPVVEEPPVSEDLPMDAATEDEPVYAERDF